MAMSLILARRTASLCLVRKGQASLGHSKLVTRPSNSFLPHAAVAPTYLISKSSFHTSKIRPAVPQILIALLKPMSRLAVMIIGRRFRKWRKNLDDEQKEQIRAKTHKYSHLLGALGFLLTSLGIYGYESHIEETPITSRRRFLALTSNQMEKICQQEFELLLEENRSGILPTTHPSYGRIAKIAQRIIASNKDIEGISNKEWTITVIDDDTRNAFVLPNGNIFVYTGMLDMCSNDDQFAIILGHEMSHAILRHGNESLSHANLISVLLIIPLAVLWSLFPNDGIALVADQIFNWIAKIILDLPHSRALETEADVVGLDLCAKACFDIREATAFWRKMDFIKQTEGEEVPQFLSTHPSHMNRLFELSKMIPAAMVKRMNCHCNRLTGPDPDIATAQAIASEKAMRANFEAESLQRVHSSISKIQSM